MTLWVDYGRSSNKLSTGQKNTKKSQQTSLGPARLKDALYTNDATKFY